MAGFVTIDPASGELDQLAVAASRWGSGVANLLLAEAKRPKPPPDFIAERQPHIMTAFAVGGEVLLACIFNFS